MSEVLVPILAVLVLVTVNGVFVAAEFALVGARRARLATMAEGGSGAAKWLLRVFDKETGKDAYIAIAQLGITLASVGLGMFGEPAVAKWLYGPLEDVGLTYDQSHVLGFMIALGGITYLHVVFGEMIPKALALQMPERVSVTLNPVMRLFGILFRPVVILLNKTAFALMPMLGIPDPGKTATLYSAKELVIATEEVASSGQLNTAQRHLIENIFEMEDRNAEQLMIPRAKMQVISATSTPEEIAAKVAADPTERYPVYEASLDSIVGVLHVKDFIRARLTGAVIDLRPMVRPIPRVAATLSAIDLMALFKKARVHAALVVDEFGGTLGFVTMDHLIADVIEDDQSAAAGGIEELPDGAMLLDGEVTLAKLAEDYGIDLARPEVVTVAGLFLAQDGTLPKIGEEITLGAVSLLAEEIEGTKITRVRLQTPKPSD